MELIVVFTVRYYRSLARKKILETDHVLEIGCSTGETTRILAERAARVVAIDNAAEMVETARQAVPRHDLEIVHMDGRDIEEIQTLLPEPDVVFFDIGGDQRLDKVTAVLRSCLRVFRPRLMVVRNIELAALMSLVTEVEAPAVSLLLPEQAPTPQDRRRMALRQLVDLSHSNLVSNRAYAARKLRDLRSDAAAAERLTEMANDPSPTVRKIVGEMPIAGEDSES